VLIVFIPLCWYLWLSAEERDFVAGKISSLIAKRRGRYNAHT
jgi:hypothetical protein